MSYATGEVGFQPNLYSKALLPMTPFIYYDNEMVTSRNWPDEKLKIGIGRRQTFHAYGTDGDGRYIPAPDAAWIVEGGIGELNVLGDGCAEFLAQAAGQGAISVKIGEREARQEITAVIPGA